MLLAALAATAAPAGGPPHWYGMHDHHEHELQPSLRQTPRPDSSGDIRPFELTAVRLQPGSAFADAQQLNTAYLRYLDLERLLHMFRVQANLPNHAPPYGGWESPQYQWGLINGHFTGHLLSALAFAASSGEHDLRRKGAALVNGLAECQATIARNAPERSGWLSAYGIDHLERMEAHNKTHVWAPYYTLHKIMAGLYDQHVQTTNAQALSVLIGLANFLTARIDRLITDKGYKWWQQCLDVEFGGMNEVAFRLFRLTKDPRHARLASYFSPDDFYAPLASGTSDPLDGLHANQHLPIIVGAAVGFETTNNHTLAAITSNFDCVLRERYTYSTGGSNVNEHWSSPNRLGDSIATRFNESTHAPHNSNGFHTQETCTTYNALKLTRHLFSWTPTAAVADEYERRLLNGILGVQQPGVIGSLSYMTPLGRGVNRNRWDWYGFGSPNNSFWCCYGTTIESFAKLGDSIYFYSNSTRASSPDASHSSTTSAGSAPSLWVSQFIPSTLTSYVHGIRVNMSAALTFGVPRVERSNLQNASGSSTAGDASPVPTRQSASRLQNRTFTATLTVRLALQALVDARHSVLTSERTSFGLDLRVRIPGWAAFGSAVYVMRGHKALSTSTPSNGTFFAPPVPSGGWLSGDMVELLLGMSPRLDPINDNRIEYASIASIMLGPLVLAGLTNETDEIQASPEHVADWVVPKHKQAMGGDQHVAHASPWKIWNCSTNSAPVDLFNGQEPGETDLELIALGRNRNYTLLPLARIALQNYTAYFNLTG